MALMDTIADSYRAVQSGFLVKIVVLVCYLKMYCESQNVHSAIDGLCALSPRDDHD
jgi:hypothetical protein